MAKKSRSRRARRASEARRRPNQSVRGPQSAPVTRTASSPTARPAAQRVASRREVDEGDRSAASAGGAVDFGSEYRYVLADLKRLGILALAMFVLLAVLALVS